MRKSNGLQIQGYRKQGLMLWPKVLKLLALMPNCFEVKQLVLLHLDWSYNLESLVSSAYMVQ